METHDAAELMRRAAPSGKRARRAQLYPARSGEQALVALDMWEIEPGGESPVVADAEEHVYYVLSGSGEFSGPGGSGPAVRVAANSVVHSGPREGHVLRNTGSQPLRVLVTSSLVVLSGRALGVELGESTPATEPAATTAPQADRDGGAPTAQEGEASEEVPTVADLGGLVKRASEIAPAPHAERKRPEPEPVPEEQATETSTEAEEPEEPSNNLMELYVVFDGGSRGNPGQGYGSFLVQSPNRRPVIKRVEFGDNYTNNQAEYDTLIKCLEYVIERLEVTNRSPEQVQLDIKTDSDLVANQLVGTFKVKDAGIRKRHTRALELLERFAEWSISWHPREESVRLLGH